LKPQITQIFLYYFYNEIYGFRGRGKKVPDSDKNIPAADKNILLRSKK
jgi:hypothetical protein